MTDVLHACKDYLMHTSMSLIDTLHTIFSDDYLKVLLFLSLSAFAFVIALPT